MQAYQEINTGQDADPVKMENKRLRWQKGLLPLMKGIIVGCCIFFFIASLGQLIYLQKKVLKPDNGLVLQSLSDLNKTEGLSFEQRIEAAKYRAVFLLENEALQRRHHQSNVFLMSRTWIKYLGFVTGMILAFVGAIFILGKLEEKSSSLNAKSEKSELSLQTNSPGIFMATLGTVLMITTIFINHSIEQIDTVIYLHNLEGEARAVTKDGGIVLPHPDSLQNKK